jgi:hypothetical protein
VLLIIKHFTMQRLADVTQDAALRQQMVAYINSITDARLPRYLADHLRDGTARARATADYVEAQVSAATSPAEATALQDAANSLREGLNPIYQGATIRDIQKTLRVDRGAAVVIKEFADSDEAAERTAAIARDAWKAITDTTRCEVPDSEGKLPEKLGYSAGKGGERRLTSNLTRTLLVRLVHLLWKEGRNQASDDATPEARADYLKLRETARKRELDHLVDLISADPKNISLVPVAQRSMFPATSDGAKSYEEAMKARLAVIVHVYFTHLHLAQYCIIGTRKAHQACKARYPRLECDEVLQELMAKEGALTELRNHGAYEAPINWRAPIRARVY